MLIPSEMDFELGQQAVAERYPVSTTKSTEAEQLASAQKLMLAASIEEAPAVRYLLLKRARETFVAASDPADAIDAQREIAWNFMVDRWGPSHEVLDIASRIELPWPASREVAKAGLHCALEALADDQYEWADKFTNIAEILARRSRDPGMITLANQLVGQLAGLHDEAPLINEAQHRLKNGSSDAADELLVGRFLCMTCRLWARGLPLLAKSSDETLRNLALRELNPPIDGNARSELADAWSELGRSMPPGREQDAVLDRAAEWYEAAEAQLQGSPRAAAGKHAVAAWADRLQHGLVADIYSGRDFAYRRFTRLDQEINWNWPTSGPEPGMGHADFSILWRGYLAPPQSGVYRIVAKADDSVRIWIGGKLAIDAKSGSNFDARSRFVALGVDPQQLLVEYHQAGGTAAVGVGWFSPGERGLRPIPGSALLHAPVEMAELFPAALTAEASGTVWLNAATAQLHGHSIHFSDHDAGPGLYGWKDPEEFPSWEFVAPAGNYVVQLTYASPAEGNYDVSINGAKATVTVAATGGADKLQATTIANVHLRGGGVTLSLKPNSAPSGQLMFLQRIVLIPAQ